MKIVHQGLMLILSSPSGAGKTTLAKKILNHDSNIHLSVSVTTRKKRDGEVDGKDYFFISKAEYDEMKNTDMLLEGAKVFDHYYGSPRKQAFDLLNKGQDVLYDVNWEGAVSLMNSARQNTVSIFILPPSMEVLEQRIWGRNKDSNQEIVKRLQEARFEISKHAFYDYIVINDDLERALGQIQSILQAERLKTQRCSVVGI